MYRAYFAPFTVDPWGLRDWLFPWEDGATWRPSPEFWSSPGGHDNRGDFAFGGIGHHQSLVNPGTPEQQKQWGDRAGITVGVVVGGALLVEAAPVLATPIFSIPTFGAVPVVGGGGTVGVSVGVTGSIPVTVSECLAGGLILFRSVEEIMDDIDAVEDKLAAIEHEACKQRRGGGLDYIWQKTMERLRMLWEELAKAQRCQ